MAWIGPVVGGLMSAYGAYASSQGGGEGGGEPSFKAAPEYPEAEGARGQWWDTLQQWGKDPNYGAISPDWEDIWNSAKRKVSEYYWGSSLSTGLADKVRASAARRRVSDSPAMEDTIARMGVEEGNQLKDLATEQNSMKATLSESARNNWLNSLISLSQQKPSGVWYNDAGFEGTSPSGAIVGALGSGISSYSQSKSQQDWLSKLFENYKDGVEGGGVSSYGNVYGASTPSGVKDMGSWSTLGSAYSNKMVS